MDKTLIRTICVISVISVVMAIILGSIASYRSTELLAAEIDEKIVATSEKYANDLSTEFNHVEGLTDSLEAYVKTTFDMEASSADPTGYIDSYKEDLSMMIVNDLSTIKSANSLYVTFNPKVAGKNYEVWHSFVDGELMDIRAHFVKDRNNHTVPEVKEMEYYFKPQNEDGGVWISSYYDRDIKKDVFSYSNAIYVDGRFIGVAGADIIAEDTVETIKNMSLYEGGYSALMDENYQFIVQNEKASAEEAEEIKSLLEEKFNGSSDAKSAKLNYTFRGTDKILGYSKMRNGWTFITVQDKNIVYQPIYSLKSTMNVLGLILIAMLLAFIVALTRPFIRKTNTLEEENRRKEITIIFQSRQAKIGEMVGNITHQWKQPLNTINLILANLLDSYRYGDLDEKRIEKSVHKVENIVNKMSETITDFSDFLKPTKKKIYFDVRDSVKSAISLMEESINLHKIKIDIISSPDSTAYGYYNETTHVIFNLLNNARDAIVEANPDRRRIRIKISRGREMLKISVENEGRNIPEDVLKNIFDPYFTTREDSGGTGLGMYISRQIVEDRLNGKISIENITGGVRCDVLIPTEPEGDDKDEG